MRNIFEERVNARLTALGINKAELARRLDIDPPNVSQTLSEGRRPQKRTIERWAAALETTADYLIGAEVDQTDALRLACIAAILKASSTELGVFREQFPHLFEPNADKPQRRSAP